MKEQIANLYEIGLEEFGDDGAAKEFVKGFLKEASFLSDATINTFKGQMTGGAGKALGAGAVALALGLGVHGLSSILNTANTGYLRDRFQQSLARVMSTNLVLKDADRTKVNSYAETIFKFAPHVAADPNLLSSVLANAVHGEGIDPMTVRTLTDLEAKVVESKKNALFSPKAYV